VDSGYTLTNFPIAIAAFVVVITGLALGAGLLVIAVGLAVLAATLVAARGFAAVERAWLPAVRDRPVPSPAYPVPRAEWSARCSPRCAIRRPGWTRCTRSSGSRSRSSASS
jgi:hypothetical protein